MTKIESTLLIIILGISSSYAQKDIDFEIFGAPVYSYRFYKSKNYIDPDLNYQNKGKDYFDKEFKNQIDDLEEPVAGYLFGIRTTFHLTNTMALQSGLDYSSIGEKAEFGYVPEFKFIETDVAQVPVYGTDNYELIMAYKYNYLSVPLVFRYNLFDLNKFDIVPFVGVSFDFLVNKSVDNSSENKEISYASKFDDDDIAYNAFSGAIHVGLELNYNITNMIQFYIYPNYKQYFTPNEKLIAEFHIGGDTHILDKIDKYNFLFGLNCGLRLRNIMHE